MSIRSAMWIAFWRSLPFMRIGPFRWVLGTRYYGVLRILLRSSTWLGWYDNGIDRMVWFQWGEWWLSGLIEGRWLWNQGCIFEVYLRTHRGFGWILSSRWEHVGVHRGISWRVSPMMTDRWHMTEMIGNWEGEWVWTYPWNDCVSWYDDSILGNLLLVSFGMIRT